MVTPMLVLAHRGANRMAPENTVAACVRALELGADGVEIDVHRTLDGALVVRHDATLPGGGVLCHVPLAVARDAVAALATLEEVLDVCSGAVVNVEIKNLPGDADWDPGERTAELVVGFLGRRGRRDDVLVSSFHLPTLDRVRKLAPQCPTGWLTAGLDPLAALASIEAHGHAALHPDVGSLAGAAAATVVGRAHGLDIRVNAWTVNDVTEIRRLADAGLDAVITDVPDTALAALGR
jgi:glycerophosphoryl diester phosphodiesterase